MVLERFFRKKKSKKPTFIMMIGLSGGGKTTRATELKKKYKFELLSSDVLRKELLHDENDQSQNPYIFEEMNKRTIKYLKEGKSVIYDATNLTVKDRRGILQRVERLKCKRIAYVMRTPYGVCLKQNENRERSIPYEVIERQRNKFQIPYYEEGFDEIILEGISKDRSTNAFFTSLFSIAELMVGIDQDSSHHAHSLFLHSMKTYEQLMRKQKFVPRALWTAAVLHDIGKLKTKKPKENNVKESCFYNHENVGTYFLLESCDLLNLRYQEILDCIEEKCQYKMLKEEKTKEKYLKKWGEEKFNNIMLLHQADLEACK